MLTRRHFVAIANVVAESRQAARGSEALETDGSLWAVEVAYEELAERMADMLAKENRNFKREVFLSACEGD